MSDLSHLPDSEREPVYLERWNYDRLCARLSALEAALEPFAQSLGSDTPEPLATHIRNARRVLMHEEQP